MENNYSDTLKKLTKKRPSVMIHIAIILLALLLAVIGIISYSKDKASLNDSSDSLPTFNPIINTEGYTKLTAIYLSEPFGSNYDNTVMTCLAIDENYKTYIILIKDNELKKYQYLIDYTYSGNPIDIPAPVTFEGTSQLIDKELKDIANEGYNAIWGSGPSQQMDFSFINAKCYLDTTQERTINYGRLAVFIISIIGLIIIYIYILDRSKKINNKTQLTIEKYKSRLNEIDMELTNSRKSFSSNRLYFTENYIVCDSFGFDIIPYENIEHIYGLNLNNKKIRINAITTDGISHVIAELMLNKNGDTLYNQILQQIQLLLPDIKYGLEDGSFSTVDVNDSLALDPVSDSKESNIILGILGAILGALLGGILWVIIGKMGFIAGIAGSVMITLSIMGYRKFSGFLDKKGKIISILIAFVMIFVAQYMLYALLYCKYYFSGHYSIQNIVYSVKNIGTFLTLTASQGDFIRDLIVGYGLSIWAGFGIIKSTFSNK